MMDNSNTNDYPILGTFVNSDASGIIARASQIYDAVSGKSVEQRIKDIDNKIESGGGLKVKVTDNILQFTLQLQSQE